jgi:hypothetical protein
MALANARNRASLTSRVAPDMRSDALPPKQRPTQGRLRRQS